MGISNVPTLFAIFGVTGDLSRRKLIPALFDLYEKGRMPQRFQIVGFSRDTFKDDAFRVFLRDAIAEKGHRHKKRDIDRFVKLVAYQQGLFEDVNSYQTLAEKLVAAEESYGQCANKLFYLAVPPAFYETILRNLAQSGLTIPCSSEEGWTRVLVEKPFGSDSVTARKLDELLGLLFKEEQIFRIDHYLAKETLQNILTFRFSNVLFEPIWNSQHIEKVEIRLFEKIGIEGRGAFYDSVGALRDVGQNHLLQMLTLIAMENPRRFDAAAVREERTKILDVLRLVLGRDVRQSTTRGQYRGYKKEKGIKRDSQAETYFRIRTYVDNERWNGVPFYLESGKKMKETKTEIVVFFKKTTSCLCPPDREQHHQNVLTFRIQPNEGIAALFWAKKPGFQFGLEPKTLAFAYQDSGDMKKLPDAYERVLFDCIRGDQTLFASTEEVSAAWKFVTPILEGWQEMPLHVYEPGSEGITLEDINRRQ